MTNLAKAYNMRDMRFTQCVLNCDLCGAKEHVAADGRGRKCILFYCAYCGFPWVIGFRYVFNMKNAVYFDTHNNW